MHILILDDGSARLDGIREVCKKHEIEVLGHNEVLPADLQKYDGIIVTGHYGDAESLTAKQNGELAQYISTLELPVCGIGRGFEVVCEAYGVNLADMGEQGAGADRLTPTNDGAKLFQGSDPIRVHESFRWNIDELPKSLAVLARSETGIEAIRHKTKPVFGIQLYPEDFAYLSDGKLVYENILATFSKHVT